jgi:hypothetical protein
MGDLSSGGARTAFICADAEKATEIKIIPNKYFITIFFVQI